MTIERMTAPKTNTNKKIESNNTMTKQMITFVGQMPVPTNRTDKAQYTKRLAAAFAVDITLARRVVKMFDHDDGKYRHDPTKSLYKHTYQPLSNLYTFVLPDKVHFAEGSEERHDMIRWEANRTPQPWYLRRLMAWYDQDPKDPVAEMTTVACAMGWHKATVERIVPLVRQDVASGMLTVHQAADGMWMTNRDDAENFTFEHNCTVAEMVEATKQHFEKINGEADCTIYPGETGQDGREDSRRRLPV